MIRMHRPFNLIEAPLSSDPEPKCIIGDGGEFHRPVVSRIVAELARTCWRLIEQLRLKRLSSS